MDVFVPRNGIFLTLKIMIKKIFSGVRAILLLLVGVYFFLIPAGMLIYDLRDPGLRTSDIPQFAYRWHAQLSAGFAAWANDRVTRQRASKLNMHDISGTEWPMFSAVYYLWATESLQRGWERQSGGRTDMPKVYAKPAIDAAIKLILDPDNATWVKAHWGDDYLARENVFYRMLLIAGLTSYQALSGDDQYRSLLQSQVERLSSEFDASPYGLLDDYPGECYPVDVLPAIAVIHRAGVVLGQDYTAFVARSLRAFEQTRLQAETALPTYNVDAKSGQGYGYARGVGIAYMLIWAPELWPDVAAQWYDRFEAHFWINNPSIGGIREFPKNSGVDDYFFEVDAGPIIHGFGAGASAFGLGAAMVNGRFDHAYVLATEALVASWPLPDGTLLIPRILSNFSDAPYLGEMAMLFIMTREPTKPDVSSSEVNMPYVVYLALLGYVMLGAGCILKARKLVRKQG